MDETAGRAVARDRGIRVLGLIGVLFRAKECNLIAAILPLLVALRNEAGFWLAKELFERVVKDAGEDIQNGEVE